MSTRVKPCMMCEAPLDTNGDCHTDGCPYNPGFDGKEFEAEVVTEEGVRGMNEAADEAQEEAAKEHRQDGEGGDLPDGEQEGESDKFSDDTDDGDHDENKSGDEGDFKLDEADEDGELPESDPEANEKIREDLRNQNDDDERNWDEDDDRLPKNHDENEPEDEKGQLDTTDELTDEGEGDLDDATDEQKQKLNEDGDQEPEDDASDDLDRQQKMDEILDQAKDMLDNLGEDDAPRDDDLPPRPQGCNGDCKPADEGQEGDPCPHCTAKQFRDQMREDNNLDDLENLSEQEKEDKFQDFLDQWTKEAEQNKGKDESDEPQKIIDAVNKAREDFSVGIFEDLMNEYAAEDLLKWFSSSELADFGDVAENNNAHTEAAYLRELSEREQKMDESDEDLPDDGDKQEDDGDLKDDESEDEDDGEFKRVAKKMSVSQEKRFDNLVKRIAPKIENTFGKTAEDFYVSPKARGRFPGDEVEQVIQIQSRGVTYFITVSAAKSV